MVRFSFVALLFYTLFSATRGMVEGVPPTVLNRPPWHTPNLKRSSSECDPTSIIRLTSNKEQWGHGFQLNLGTLTVPESISPSIPVFI